MKKKITLVAVAILCVMLTACHTLGAAVPTQAAGEITREEAVELALKDAGVTAEQVTGLRANRDWDDGILYYDVDFYRDGVEYEYEIHAQTGKILKAEKGR